jgi:hypothetical protein
MKASPFSFYRGAAAVMAADLATTPTSGISVQLCGATLARAHARSGDAIAIASYLGKNDAFDRAVSAFSAAYAEQNRADFAAFVAAI